MSVNNDRYAVLTDDELKVIASELANMDLGLDCSKKGNRKPFKVSVKSKLKTLKGKIKCPQTSL